MVDPKQLVPESLEPGFEERVLAEVKNLQAITRGLRDYRGRLPNLPGIEIAAVSLPVDGVLGGDHIIFLDFQKRFDLPKRIAEAEKLGLVDTANELRKCADRAGVLLADISGHQLTDVVVAAMLHQSFLLGAYYELDRNGRMTTRLFEHINQRLFETMAVNKYLTMIYGEVSIDGSFHFICAGHPLPLVYSRAFGCFVSIPNTLLATFPPVGMFPSGEEFVERSEPSPRKFKQGYRVNKIKLLSPGDLIFLYTDGLSELSSGNYIADHLEALIGEVRDLEAHEIAERIRADIDARTDREDDVTFVIIKRSVS